MAYYLLFNLINRFYQKSANKYEKQELPDTQ